MSAVRPQTRYVTVGDADVAYQVLGQGPPDLLLLNGAVASHVELNWQLSDYSDLYKRLASFARLILFDRRGTGASDDAPLNATWEDLADDAGAVLDAVGSTQAAIIGALDGAKIAVLFAAMHPDRTAALVLVNGFAQMTRGDDYPIGQPPEVITAMLDMLAAGWGTPELARLAAPSRADDDDFAERAAAVSRAAATPRAAAEYMRRVSALDIRHALPLIEVPTLVLHAKENAFVPIDMGLFLAEHIRGARFVELAGGDCTLTGKTAAALPDEIADFLTGQRPANAERVLATVVFTDIADSTATASSLGDRRWKSLLDSHDEAVRAALRRFRGREINTTGDGFVASFDGPARAIHCARSIVDATRALGIQVRAGVHTGECEVRGDDLGGLAVHIAARVAKLASPGEALVSRTVVDLVAGSGIAFEDRGEHELKGVPGTWKLYAVES